MLRIRELRKLTKLVAAAAIVAGVGMAGCGGGGGTTASERAHHPPRQPASGGFSKGEQRAATRRLGRELGVSAGRIKRLRSGHGLAATSIRPGEIVPGGPGPFFSSDVISPIRNGWEASDRRSYTGIDAGGNPADHSVGELGIFRQNFIKGTQDQHVVEVPDAGAVKITRAPLGRSVATWAQHRGNFRFVGARGVQGTLHLATDKVTITRPNP